ncbi:hypothetical protein SETIT_1G137900v2 [Setaria italica]|uniref:Uncharacterized protein n=1 Tax=Setaria italica TaxID=4555 RepID=A0A368PK02_SETIT|nr:hypothetical protein SETIT_1G137900v2 [Setaria italica]
MDNNQMMIPGNIYQTWLKDASSLVSKRRKVNSNFDFIRSTKISDLMDMPLVALMSYLHKSSSELCYPKPLVQLWKECTAVNCAKASSSAGQPSSSQEKQPRNSTPHEFPPQTEGEYEMETGPHPMDFTDGIEKLRGNALTLAALVGSACVEYYDNKYGSSGPKVDKYTSQYLAHSHKD